MRVSQKLEHGLAQDGNTPLTDICVHVTPEPNHKQMDKSNYVLHTR